MRLHFENNIFVVSRSPRARPFAFNHLETLVLRGSYKETFRRGSHNVNKFTYLMKNSPKCLICLKHEKDYNYSLQVYFNYVIRLGKAVGLTLLFSTKLSFYFHSNSLTKA